MWGSVVAKLLAYKEIGDSQRTFAQGAQIVIKEDAQIKEIRAGILQALDTLKTLRPKRMGRDAVGRFGNDLLFLFCRQLLFCHALFANGHGFVFIGRIVWSRNPLRTCKCCIDAGWQRNCRCDRSWLPQHLAFHAFPIASRSPLLRLRLLLLRLLLLRLFYMGKENEQRIYVEMRK